ncbi:UDP-N-acetylmuramoyl-L-alanyl-D-glutamate--2,6-diaminopimelate ligase [Pseudomonas sp. HK3]
MIVFNQPLAVLKPWVESLPQGLFDLEIQNICFDSREVSQGDAFFVLPSVAGNESVYITQAINNGASVIVVDEKLSQQFIPDASVEAVPYVFVSDIMATAGNVLAQCLYQSQLDMQVVGITGTNGKSSISFYLAQLLNELNGQCAVMGTVGYGQWDNLIPSGMTTLPLEKLHHVLSELSEDYKSVAMEVSSHGLEQNRLAGVAFSGAVFSNLSRDHLDYHGTMDAYGEAKALLFTRPELKFVVINADDDFAQSLAQKSYVKPVFYGQLDNADLRFELIKMHEQGMDVQFTWQTESVVVSLPLFGKFNAENVAAAILCCLKMGFNFSDIIQASGALQAVPGRMQHISVNAQQPIVLVDYAHTPDALEQILMAIKQHTTGQITLIVGCGGDRDAGKRSLMGNIALQNADKTIITSDNPRSEDPLTICEQMVDGLSGNYVIEVDRAQAIKRAITQASNDDIVIIAGKGHEDYQEINGQRRYFSDAEEAKSVLQLGSQA